MTAHDRAAIDEMNPDGVPRKVLFVAGAGRSGTSTMAGIASKLGMHVPLPEVPADASNPRGFSEPQWVVDLHDRLLKEAGVQVSDSRPSAWFETGRISTREPARIRVAEWLEPHFDVHPELVVKDPRLSWFLGLWRVAAIRTGATPVFVTMLRPPAEVVGSKQKYYANKLGSAHLAASWLNMLLHTERATREEAGSAPGVRALRGPADRLGEDHDARRAHPRPAVDHPHAQRPDPRGAPLHRPDPATGDRRPSTTSRCRRGCTS